MTSRRTGYFGEFGGRFVPETLVPALIELEAAWAAFRADRDSAAELDRLLADWVGRPTPLQLAERLTRRAGGARIWLKREDLCHTGAHKINNALGQGLLARRLGKRRVIAETGAGQHGVATATVAALLGLRCEVFMGAEDVRRQRPNVERMRLLGATVNAVDAGSRTLKDAINEAIRDWVTRVETTQYVIGSAVGPHPYPQIVAELQSVIGREAREQILERAGRLPDAVVACVGGGSNAIGSFRAFVEDDSVALHGAEAGGDGHDAHAATLSAGRPGVLHGARSLVLQDENGQVTATHSVSAGLDYPGVGPEHAWLAAAGRVRYAPVGDREALAAFRTLAECEGILPALESAHAVARGLRVATDLPVDADVIVTLSGRGDKDLDLVREVSS